MSGVVKVTEFIKKFHVKAEILEFKNTVETVSLASKASGFPKHKILKTLIIFADKKPCIAIVRGDKKLDLKRVAKILGVRRVRLAKLDEVVSVVGVKPGEVSPLLEDVLEYTILMDESVLEEKNVLVGGGSLKHLVKISTDELVRILNPKIANITL